MRFQQISALTGFQRKTKFIYNSNIDLDIKFFIVSNFPAIFERMPVIAGFRLGHGHNKKFIRDAA